MGEREWVGLAGLGVLLILLLLRIPVGLAMVVTGIGGAWVLSLVAPFLRFEPYLRQFKTLLWDTVANYELSVVPLFILMGYLAAHGGLSRDLFRGFYALVGRWPGGVAVATVGACAGFGAVCGSSLATASTMGRVALPELYRVGYAPALATGVLAAGGPLGILIPPSVALVLYSVVVEVSIIDAFRAAVVPGLMAVVAFAGLTALTAWRRPDLAPSIPPPDPRQRRRDLAGLVPVALIFAGLLVGLGLGLFTPTPAAGIGVLAVLGYGLFKGWRGHGLGWHGLRQSLLDTAVTAGMIYFILFAAEVLKGFFARAGLPAALAGWAAASGLDPWVILA
ncbi:MAG: TRAP transporter large permease, partial [Candidatus Competibacterales bacterium]